MIFRKFTVKLWNVFGALRIMLLMLHYASSVTEFYIGVVMIYDANTPYDVERVGPAIEIAIDRVNKDILNSSYQITKIERHYGSICSNSRASGVVADMYYTEKVDAVIGPACAYALDPVARLANYWNIPIITGLGDGGLFRNKTNYPTLTRLAYCQCRLRKVLGSIFEEFEWTDVAIIYDINDIHSEVIGTTLKDGLQKQNIYPNMFPYYGKDNPDFAEILMEVRKVTRVVVLVTPGESIRKLMLEAFDLGFISSGEFVFFDIHLFPFPGEYWGNHDWRRSDSRDQDAKTAYEAMLRISLEVPTSSEWSNFTENVKYKAKQLYNFTFHDEEVNFFIGAFHDAVLLYGLALNESLANNNAHVVKDGYHFTRTMWNRTFEGDIIAGATYVEQDMLTHPEHLLSRSGVTGHVIMDDNGDRDTSYSILDLDPNTGEFHVIANFFGDRQWYNPLPSKSVHWPGGRTTPPLNTPICGFQGDEPVCDTQLDASSGLVYAVAAVMSSLFVICVAAIIVCRHFKRERDLQKMVWLIRFEDINFHTNSFSTSVGSMPSVLVARRSSYFSEEPGAGSLHGSATYMGTLVTVTILKKKIELTRKVLMELHQMRMMAHENLTRFIGASLEPLKVCLVHEFCSKGCLENITPRLRYTDIVHQQDLLENDSIKLDIAFKLALLKDMATGMSFIQSSSLKYHGYLTSKCCMVDSRFVVKISDYGLPTFYTNARQTHHGQQLWVAPEHLRRAGHSIKGDVYSFAIIMVEVLTRATPYDVYRVVMDVQEIVCKIQNTEYPLFRPIVPLDRGPPELLNMLVRCWSEEPEDRPDFHTVNRSLRKIIGGKETNLVDMLLRRMEKYANNLEEIVEERTKLLMAEKKRSEQLLHEILPKSVAMDLLQGRQVLPEQFESVTVYFSDLVDFTAMCLQLSPLEVIDVMNEIYTLFDNVLDKYNVYKVETVGDAYMVASGVPIRNGHQHVVEISRMALDLLDRISDHQLKHDAVDKVKLRIGIHTGSCVTGVIGLKMPRYCLFGDTVNTAARMESTGAALKIQISESTKKAMDGTGFQVECRGDIEVKGKGTMTTYWLLGERKTAEEPLAVQISSNV